MTINAQRIAESLETARANREGGMPDDAFYALCDAVEEILVALDPRPPLPEVFVDSTE